MSETKINKTESAELIYTAIPAIMAEIPSIYKDRKNDAQHYNFRGIDDVYNAVNPILAKHRVFMRADVLDVKREERPPKDSTKGILAFVQVRVRYSFVAADGSFISTDSLGEGMDSGDKATAKAMSIAQKYAILQMFCIPTIDPKDPEDDNPEPTKAKIVNPKSAIPTAKPKAASREDDGGPPWGDDENEQRATIEQMAAISKQVKVIAYHGKTEDEVYAKVAANLKKVYGVETAELNELTIEQADRVLSFLKAWAAKLEVAKQAEA